MGGTPAVNTPLHLLEHAVRFKYLRRIGKTRDDGEKYLRGSVLEEEGVPLRIFTCVGDHNAAKPQPSTSLKTTSVVKHRAKLCSKEGGAEKNHVKSHDDKRKHKIKKLKVAIAALEKKLGITKSKASKATGIRYSMGGLQQSKDGRRVDLTETTAGPSERPLPQTNAVGDTEPLVALDTAASC